MSSSEESKKVRDLVEDIRIGMLTTVDRTEGRLKSRPMAVSKVEDDGTLWFLTDEHTEKARELEADPTVNVAFSGGGSWVSLAGRATIVDDPAVVKDLWNSHAEAWFPDGPDTPSIGALRVDPDGAEYWESPGKARIAFGYLKSKVTGGTPSGGENERVEL